MSKKQQQQQTLILIWLYKKYPIPVQKSKVVNFSSEIFYQNDKKYEIKKWVFDTKHFKFVFKILNKSFRYWYSVS